MRVAAAVFLFACSCRANDIVYLKGLVRMQNGSAPGRSVPIQLVCKGADPLRQTNAGKNGAFYLKVERDDFNRVARSLSATTMDAGDGGLAGACGIQASLAGYESNTIDLGSFTIGKDLKLPPLILKPKTR
ncbi:MAG: hypothetical protein ABSH49_20470 [Bryobacteraceae bacterium]